MIGSRGLPHVKGSGSRLPLALLLVLLVSGSAVAQQTQPPEIVRVRVGFSDRYKAGTWTPVEVTLRGGSEALIGRMVLATQDSDGVATRFTSPENGCQVLPGRETSATLYVRFGQAGGGLEAEFLVGGARVASKTFEAQNLADADHIRDAVESGAMIVQLGPAAGGLEEATALAEPDLAKRAEVARVRNAAELPTHWYGYEGVDALVLFTSRPEVYRTLTADGARVKALDQWIRMGGKLVLCVGAQGDQVLRAGMPLAGFSPGRFERTVDVPQTAALETYVGSTVPVAAAGAAGPMRASRLADVKGKIEAEEGDLPLVIRSPRGLGQVIFVAVDPDLAPLSRWADRKLLAARLLELPSSTADAKNEPGMHFGFNDLAGQLRSALDQFTGVRVVPFSLVALLVIGYILLIGPGDYFFLRKVLRGRMVWTWLTFPLIVAGVSLGAYALAYWFKGDQLRMHQVDVVDVDAASGFVRGTSWMNLFSPRMEKFNLAIQGRLPSGAVADDAESVIAWLGLPGDGLGGMDRRREAPGAGLSGGQYDFAPGLDQIRNVPIQVWSTKSFTARWSATTVAVGLKTDLSEADRMPQGTITNTLEVPLADCMLAYDRWAYLLGAIEPGQSVEIGRSTRRIDLKTLLTGRKLLFDKQEPSAAGMDGADLPAEAKLSSAEAASPYDQSSTDAPYILRAMMFFDLAGGRRYTHLANDYQQFIDLSGLLKAGRAVLVAWPADDRRGAEVLRDNHVLNGPQDKHTTVYRFVLPVEAK